MLHRPALPGMVRPYLGSRASRVTAVLLTIGLVPVGVVAFQSPAYAATFRVTTTSDRPDANLTDGVCRTSTGSCSLRAALQQANRQAGPDVITVPNGRYILGMARGVPQPPSIDADNDLDLDITDSVTINGAGNAGTIVDGGGHSSVLGIDGLGTPTVSISRIAVLNGGESDRSGFGFGGGLAIRRGAWVTLTNVVVADSRTTLMGSGIYNEGGLVLKRSIVRDNRNLSSLGGGGVTATGGGIFNSSTGVLTVDQSTVSGNFSLRGGGIANSHGRVDIINSTITGNTAQNNGGGLRNTGDSSGASGVMNITFSTIIGNKANQPRAADQFKVGGGLANFGGQVNMGGTILAGNSDERTRFSWDANMRSPDCYSTEMFRFTSFRNNLVGALSPNCVFNDTIWGGTPFDLVSRDLEAPVDAKLRALDSSIGPTPTHAPFWDSPAVDLASSGTSASFFACPGRDQREITRPIDGNFDFVSTCDTGAVEIG
jgi:CSLREA domain-containing protein